MHPGWMPTLGNTRVCPEWSSVNYNSGDSECTQIAFYERFEDDFEVRSLDDVNIFKFLLL